MSIAEKLTTIAENEQRVAKILEDCNYHIIGRELEEATNLSELPDKVAEVYNQGEQSGYNTGRLDGYDEGYESGYSAGQQAGGGGGSYDEGYAAGQKAENDRFWDGYLENGNRQNCNYLFFGSYWTDETFKPKHSISPTAAQYMFSCCGELDLVGALERCGVTIDFSRCTQFSYMLSNGAEIKHFPTIDLSAASNFTDGFRYGANLESVSFVNVASKHTWSNAFTNCSALVDVSFDGTIGKTVSFSSSSKLSRASIENILSVLADDVTGQTVTFNKAAVNKAFETSEGANDGSTNESSGWFTLINDEKLKDWNFGF